MAKNALLVIAISYSLALAILSLINISLPNIGPNYKDKIFHLLAYGFLSLIWYSVLYKFKKSSPIFISFTASIIYGIIFEVLQGQLTTVREPDIMDVLANSIGAGIISLFLIFRKKAVAKKL